MIVHSYQPTPHFHGMDWKDVKSNDNIRNEGSSERIVLNVIFDFFFSRILWIWDVCVFVCIFVCSCVYVCECVCIFVCICVYLFVFVYICVYLCVCL